MSPLAKAGFFGRSYPQIHQKRSASAARRSPGSYAFYPFTHYSLGAMVAFRKEATFNVEPFNLHCWQYMASAGTSPTSSLFLSSTPLAYTIGFYFQCGAPVHILRLPYINCLSNLFLHKPDPLPRMFDCGILSKETSKPAYETLFSKTVWIHLFVPFCFLSIAIIIFF